MKKKIEAMGLTTDGTPVIVCSSEPISRRLPNGDVLIAYSESAKQEFDPLLIVDALEREWKFQ